MLPSPPPISIIDIGEYFFDKFTNSFAKDSPNSDDVIGDVTKSPFSPKILEVL